MLNAGTPGVPAFFLTVIYPTKTVMRSAVKRRRWMRRLASLFLAFHVAAIIVAPASVEPTSPFWLSGWEIVRPYAQMVFLDQGWNFFSPEPGPSTLISFHAKTDDGEVINRRLPNKEIQPRLLYHRHFMVTSYMGYQAEEDQELICEGFLSHIKAKYNTEEVEFTKWVHLLPSQDHIRNGGTLHHADLWEEHVFVESEPEKQEPTASSDTNTITNLDSQLSADSPAEK